VTVSPSFGARAPPLQIALFSSTKSISSKCSLYSKETCAGSQWAHTNKTGDQVAQESARAI
jgi:hypothetical protein